MIEFIGDFLTELPSILIFGFVCAISAIIAVFAPSLIYKICSIFSQNGTNGADLSPVPSSASVSTGIARPSKSRRKRNAFKRLYSNIVQDESTSSDENNGGSSTPSSRKRRRHSTAGPFHFARKAKEFIRSHTYNRKYSEAFRGTLPKPPTEFFMPADAPEITPGMSAEMYYTRLNLSMLELPDAVSFNQEDIEVRLFEQDDLIVRPGDADNCAYVVLEGSLTAYISPSENKEIAVKKILAGNSFFSLLSLIDILMQIPSKFKTVSLRASERSRVAIFSFNRFRGDFEKNPDLWIRPIQIILTRMLHVTLTTLHNQMGLGEQLLKKKFEEREDPRMRQVSGHSMRLHGGRPGKLRQRRLSSSDAHVSENPRHHKWAQQMSVDESSSVYTPASVYTPNVLQMRRKIMTIAEDQNEFQNLAVKWFGEALGLNSTDSHDLLHSRIIINSLDEGRILNEQGSNENAQLILVLKGSLKIIQEPYDDEEDDTPESCLTLVHPREIVGGLQLLTNEPCFYTISANVPTLVAVLNSTAFAEIIQLRPQICLPVAFSVMRRLSTFVRAVDFAIDWVLLDSGQAVYRQGDNAESMFVVLSGRLRSVDKKVAIEEFGRGDALGMIEVLQKKPRQTTVLAVRYSQLARVPEGLLNFVKMQYPQVGFRLVRLLGQFYSDSRRAQLLPIPLENSLTPDPIAQVKNLHTIAIMPASLDVPLTSFICELYHVLNVSTRVLHLSSQKIAKTLGDSVLEKQADFRLMHWLNAQEDGYSLILYECDFTATNWTRRCLKQADTILVVGLGNEKAPKRQLIEDHLQMNQDGIRTTKKLVLLWKEDTESPFDTYEWLKGSWFSGHYHLKAANRMFQWSWKNEQKEIVGYYEDSVFPTKIDFNSDFSRLGRILTGNAVGLVLGGGGARGAAHVGIIRALREHGIPVDIVGGTSIGAMIGGVFAENPRSDYETRAKSWFNVMTSLWQKIWDLTYAYTAMFTGAGFNRTLQDLFGEKDIEDMWLTYFCVTTDISTSEMRVHRSGPLWAYVRASMSLAGYLPPLCDPNDGHHLLDGGYVNNLPADVMRNMGARCVIAVDVGSVAETDLYNHGDSLSGIWILLNKLNPWAKPIKILDMQEIQSRLAFVSCVRQLELVKKAPYCHYLRPPIDCFQTLEFARFDHIASVGYEYGFEKVSELVQTNDNIKSVMNPDTLRSLTSRKTRGRHRERAQSMRNSFTDLAAQISRIPSKKRGSLTDISVFDENFDDSSDLDSSSYDDMSEEGDEDFDDEELMIRTRTPHVSESLS